MMPPNFTLSCEEVPDPPASSEWAAVLRWLICVMDPDDAGLPFIAACLSYAIPNDGLTAAQASACQTILTRVLEAWGDDALVCQNTEPDDIPMPEPTTRTH